MKRSYLILGSLCAALAITDVVLAIALPDSTPVTAESAPAENDGFDYSWTNLSPYIAHAGGGILGHSYTNSYESLAFNYQLGHRLFELDFSLSSDNELIATHDPTTTSTDTFNSTLVENKFHPVSIDRLLDFLYHHPDVYIITDTKYTDEESTRSLLEHLRTAAEDLDPTILDRFIIQIYHPDMLPWVMDIYPWKSIIYTLYQNPEWTPENVLAFAESSGVKYITLFYAAASDEALDLWHSAGLYIGVHTINDLPTAKEASSRGATNVYTDYLLP